MIARIHKTTSPSWLINYLLQATKQAQIVDSSLYTPAINSLIAHEKVITDADNKQVASQVEKAFSRINGLNPRLRNNVTHLIIGFDPKDDQVSPEYKGQIARDLMEQMGYGDTYWIGVAHDREDPEHDDIHDQDHMHILAARVDTDGKTISDSWDYLRVAEILRGIEQSYELTPFVPFWEREYEEYITPEIQWILYPEQEEVLQPRQTNQYSLSN